MLRPRPRLAAAMAEGWLSESFADRVVAWTRRGWDIELRADGTVTATSPDGQVLRGHPPPATRPA